MIVILGSIIVIGCVLAGFVWSGGHIHALIHPSEVLTIGGATLGAMITMSSKHVLKDLLHGIMGAFKGCPYNKQAYSDLFKLSYELLRVMRRDGLLAMEPHLGSPETSPIFQKYPKILGNKHILSFLCDGLAPLIDGGVEVEAIEGFLEAELHVIEEEHHVAVGVLQKSADALPGFGIVAAVLGIVITMGAINGPVDEIGHKVGAALVGTFLGILASYGFIGPLAARMELLGHMEIAYFRTVATIIVACAKNGSPKAIVEQARRGVGSEFRIARAALDTMIQEVEAA
jgi:chemotaxis protein MotA